VEGEEYRDEPEAEFFLEVLVLPEEPKPLE
jgi:hypothetical protein